MGNVNYKYRVIPRTSHIGETQLQSLYNEGWELVTTASWGGDYVYYYFKKYDISTKVDSLHHTSLS